MWKAHNQLVIKSTQAGIDYQSLVLAYQPLIKSDAMTLYLVLQELSKSVRQSNVQIVASLVNISVEHLEELRKILEQFGLVKTFVKDECYLITVYPPLSLKNFLKHEVFGRLYIEQNGEPAYKLLSSMVADQPTSGFENISEPFNKLVGSRWNNNKEELYQANKNIHVEQYDFDFDKMLEGNYDLIWPKAHRRQSDYAEIAKVANIYAHNEKVMRKLVANSIVNGFLDVDKLRELAAKSTQISHFSGNKYQNPPLHFLRELQNGAPVSQSDKDIISVLLEKYHFSNEVVNVLLEYVLAQCNQRLVKNYVTKVASSWSRANVDTYDKAIERVKQETGSVTFDRKNPYETLKQPQIKNDVNSEAKQEFDFDDF